LRRLLKVEKKRFMNQSDENKIKQWGREFKHNQRIKVVLGRQEESAYLEEFCDRLKALAPALSIVRTENSDGQPGIHLSENIVYRAVPENAELDLFLGAVAGVFYEGTGMIKPPDEALVQSLEESVNFDVYISSHCPFCPHVVSAMLLVAAASSLVNVNIIDGTIFTKQAQDNEIKAVPTVILDGRFRWTGQVNMNEIMDVAVSGSSTDFGVETLKSIVEGGNAQTVAQMMMDRGELYPAFIELLTDEKWSVRLGAMVVFEYLAESDDLLAGLLIEALWERFDLVDDNVKGDILHLFGESNRKDARNKVESVILNTSYSAAVLEAAKEALE